MYKVKRLLFKMHEDPIHRRTMSTTFFASQGDVDGLKLAHEQGVPWDAHTCAAAAEADSLACLKFAHENGCPWNEHVVMSAVKSNSVECLRYAFENGCEVSENVAEFCSYIGNIDCLLYILTTDSFPVDKDRCLQAVIEGTQDTDLKLIRRLQYLLDANKENFRQQDYVELCDITKQLFSFIKLP
jgi:hypothetical protein